jgi:hypothetical protein
MNNVDIAYDLYLEELYEEIRTQIWLNEELQLQPKTMRKSILETLKQFSKQKSSNL